MEDATIELIKRVQQGDQVAFESLYRQNYARAYKVAYRAMHNEQDAQDVVQESFIQVEQSIKGLRDPNLFHAWFQRIVISKANDLYYSRRHYGNYSEGIARIQKENRTYMLPQMRLSIEEDQRIVRTFIQELKPKYQEVMIMYYFKQYQIEEIAAYLNLPSGTIKSRMSRGKELLAHKISLFEKQNGRKLDFNLEGVTGALAASGVFAYLKQWKQALPTWLSSTPMLMTVSIVLISSTWLAGQAYQQDQNQPPLTLKEGAPKDWNSTISNTSFGVYTYEDRLVKDSKSAYFTCLAWAEDKSALQDRTKGEYRRMKPIYDALKQCDDAYYDMLQKNDWTASFEYYAIEYGL